MTADAADPDAIILRHPLRSRFHPLFGGRVNVLGKPAAEIHVFPHPTITLSVALQASAHCQPAPLQ
jgi:hypothetical protein